MSITSRRLHRLRPSWHSSPCPRRRLPATAGPVVRSLRDPVRPPDRPPPAPSTAPRPPSRSSPRAPRQPHASCASRGSTGRRRGDVRGPPPPRPVRRRQRRGGPRPLQHRRPRRGSRRPRSARTPRCGSTSASRTVRRPRRHPCRSCPSPGTRSVVVHALATDHHTGARRGPAGLPPGRLVMRRGTAASASGRPGSSGAWSARVFMRLLTTAPGFSWSGTLFILGLAAVAGACLGVVHAARVAERSRWWRLAALPALALFAGPGMLLAPAAIGMAMVLRGGRVVRVVGAVVVTGSPLLAVLSDEDGRGDARPSRRSRPHGAVGRAARLGARRGRVSAGGRGAA